MRRLIPTGLLLTLLVIVVAFVASYGPASAARPVQNPPVPQLYLTDSTGQMVGVFSNVLTIANNPMPTAAVVIVPTSQGNVALLASKTRLYASSTLSDGTGNWIYFEGTGCTGAAYMTSIRAEPSMTTYAAITSPGRTLWVATDATAVDTTVCSRRGPGTQCEDISCGLAGGFPAVPLYDVDAQFPPPYALMQR